MYKKGNKVLFFLLKIKKPVLLFIPKSMYSGWDSTWQTPSLYPDPEGPPGTFPTEDSSALSLH